MSLQFDQDTLSFDEYQANVEETYNKLFPTSTSTVSPSLLKKFKNTDELVTYVRLEEIQKENKSITSILDTRKLYQLQDIPGIQNYSKNFSSSLPTLSSYSNPNTLTTSNNSINSSSSSKQSNNNSNNMEALNKRLERAEINKRISSRRNGKISENISFYLNNKDININTMLIQNKSYELEESIWKFNKEADKISKSKVRERQLNLMKRISTLRKQQRGEEIKEVNYLTPTFSSSSSAAATSTSNMNQSSSRKDLHFDTAAVINSNSIDDTSEAAMELYFGSNANVSNPNNGPINSTSSSPTSLGDPSNPQSRNLYGEITDEEIDLFAKSLTPSQRTYFNDLIMKNIISISDRLRKKCVALKQSMDEKNIFHTDANAHRVYSIYISMLFKELNCNRIEDNVLRYMLSIEKKNLEEKNLYENQKNNILKNLEMNERNSQGLSDKNDEKIKEEEKKKEKDEKKNKKGLGSSSSSIASSTINSLHSKSTFRSNINSKMNDEMKKKITQVKQSNNNKKTLPSSLSSSFLPTAAPLSSGLNNTNLSASTSSIPLASSLNLSDKNFTTASTLPVTSSTQQGPLTSSSLLNTTGGGNSTPSNPPFNPIKLFHKKMGRNDRMGFVSSSIILTDEAKKLNEAPVINYKKNKNRSNILEEKLSIWMINSIQNETIGKSSSGMLASTVAPALTGTISLNESSVTFNDKSQEIRKENEELKGSTSYSNFDRMNEDESNQKNQFNDHLNEKYKESLEQYHQNQNSLIDSKYDISSNCQGLHSPIGYFPQKVMPFELYKEIHAQYYKGLEDVNRYSTSSISGSNEECDSRRKSMMLAGEYHDSEESSSLPSSPHTTHPSISRSNSSNLISKPIEPTNIVKKLSESNPLFSDYYRTTKFQNLNSSSSLKLLSLNTKLKMKNLMIKPRQVKPLGSDINGDKKKVHQFSKEKKDKLNKIEQNIKNDEEEVVEEDKDQAEAYVSNVYKRLMKKTSSTDSATKQDNSNDNKSNNTSNSSSSLSKFKQKNRNNIISNDLEWIIRDSNEFFNQQFSFLFSSNNIPPPVLTSSSSAALPPSFTSNVNELFKFLPPLDESKQYSSPSTNSLVKRFPPSIEFPDKFFACVKLGNISHFHQWSLLIRGSEGLISDMNYDFNENFLILIDMMTSAYLLIHFLSKFYLILYKIYKNIYNNNSLKLSFLFKWLFEDLPAIFFIRSPHISCLDDDEDDFYDDDKKKKMQSNHQKNWRTISAPAYYNKNENYFYNSCNIIIYLKRVLKNLFEIYHIKMNVDYFNYQKLNSNLSKNEILKRNLIFPYNYQDEDDIPYEVFSLDAIIGIITETIQLISFQAFEIINKVKQEYDIDMIMSSDSNFDSSFTFVSPLGSNSNPTSTPPVIDEKDKLFEDFCCQLSQAKDIFEEDLIYQFDESILEGRNQERMNLFNQLFYTNFSESTSSNFGNKYKEAIKKTRNQNIDLAKNDKLCKDWILALPNIRKIFIKFQKENSY